MLPIVRPNRVVENRDLDSRGEILSAHIGSSPVDDDSAAIRSVLLIFLVAYAVHGVLVVFSYRHLYGDAAWYLVRMLSEGRVTQFYLDFSREFYYSRFLSYWLTQLPTVAALQLGITNVAVLSFIYGATLFSWKLFSLAVCYWLLPKRDKAFVVFPLLGVVSGTINSEIYLVSEVHISAAFIWPLLIAVIWLPTPLTRARAICIAVAIAITSFLYESVALLLLAPLAVLLWRLRRHDLGRGGLANAHILIATLATGIVMNWAAILFPRDPANKSAFGKGISLLLHDALRGIGHLHAGPAVSIAFFFIATAVMLMAGRIRKTAAGLGAGCLATFPSLHFLKYHDSLVFSNSITDRGIGVVVQCGLVALLILAYRHRQFRSRVASAEVAILLGGLVLGQLSWHALATKSWIEATAAVRQVLATRAGPQFCPSISDEYSKSLTVGLDRILCNWWITPLSIVLAPAGQVKSIMLSPDSFRPFDPLAVKSLPSMRFVPVNYDEYLRSLATVKTLARGETVAFTTRGQGWLLTTTGFSHPESWGTWSEGKLAAMSFCIKDGVAGKQDIHLRFKVAAFVPEARPRLVVAIAAKEKQLGEWVFGKGDAIVDRFVNVPPDLSERGCTNLVFTMSDVTSPASLGISGDPRMLGLALVEMKVEP